MMRLMAAMTTMCYSAGPEMMCCLVRREMMCSSVSRLRSKVWLETISLMEVTGMMSCKGVEEQTPCGAGQEMISCLGMIRST